MSETSVSESSSPQSGKLYDEAGRPLRSGQSQQTTEELIRFAREHPVGTAFGALALGYILGKMF